MKTTELKKGFQDGKYEELLRDIYIDESVRLPERTLYQSNREL